MITLSKIVRLGTQTLVGNTFCKIIIDDGCLSITGVEGPQANGSARGSCGQIIMSLQYSNFVKFAPGWDIDMVKTFCSIWEEFHLNDMLAGSSAQRRFIKTNSIETKDYPTKLAALRDAGLSPDNSYLHNGKPYVYGSSWLKDELPNSVVEFLAQLPETDLTPAWV